MGGGGGGGGESEWTQFKKMEEKLDPCRMFKSSQHCNSKREAVHIEGLNLGIKEHHRELNLIEGITYFPTRRYIRREKETARLCYITVKHYAITQFNSTSANICMMEK